MRVYFSTVFRYAPPDQGGEFVCLDWDSKTILHRTPVLLDNFPLDDPNPRGNSRGGRGLAVVDGQVLATTYHTLKVFDQNLKLVRSISHPLMAGLHEIYPENNARIWVTSTSIDAALLIDLQTGAALRQYWPREMPTFQQRWGLEPLTLDKQADNRPLFLDERFAKEASHIHFNAVAQWRGQTYGLFNRFGAIVNLDTEEVCIEEPKIRGCHNLIIREDGLTFVNDTRGHQVYIYDLPQRRLVRIINLLPFHPAGLRAILYDLTTQPRHFLKSIGVYKPREAMPFFVRGLDLMGDELFIGISPASILRLNWQQGRLIDRYSYSDNILLAVHGLKVTAD